MDTGYQKPAKGSSLRFVIGLVLLGLVYTVGVWASTPPGKLVRVKWVADGDTVVLLSGEKVRLIGIDAPETHHPEKPVEPFGPEAAEYLRQLVEGKEVLLVLDKKHKDEYSRTLGYLFLQDLFVNAHLVKEGYARASSRRPNTTYESLFAELEGQAQSQGKGMWKK
jgi:micrococcal nuclease